MSIRSPKNKYDFAEHCAKNKVLGEAHYDSVLRKQRSPIYDSSDVKLRQNKLLYAEKELILIATACKRSRFDKDVISFIVGARISAIAMQRPTGRDTIAVEKR